VITGEFDERREIDSQSLAEPKIVMYAIKKILPMLERLIYSNNVMVLCEMKGGITRNRKTKSSKSKLDLKT